MKKLKFDYVMRLSFDTPVTDHRFQLRCVPATGARQQIVDVDIQLEPSVEPERMIDSFDSVVMTGLIAEPHTTFGYTVRGIAFVDTEHTKPEPYKPLYQFNTALTEPGDSITALTQTCAARLQTLSDGADDVERAQQIMHEVYAAFTYTPGSTTIRTTAEQALAQGKGVCQDYAHVMLSICRSLGMTVRYIAGLLCGEGATHAWVEVYHDGCWIGLDPTHDRMVDDTYITIAHGRDYRDCMLDIGIFSSTGPVTQTQWVNASVHEQEV